MHALRLIRLERCLVLFVATQHEPDRLILAPEAVVTTAAAQSCADREKLDMPKDSRAVLGSIGVPDLRLLYFVEWDSKPVPGHRRPREPNFEDFVKQIFSKRSNNSTLNYLHDLTHVLPHLLNIANNPNLSDWKAPHIEYRSNHCHGEG